MRAQRARSGGVPAGVRTAILAIAVALAATALALGQTDQPRPDGDDSRSQVDIASVRGTHDMRADRLVHAIRTHDPISPRSFRNSVSRNGPPGSVCVNVWTRRTPREQAPDFDVCVTADRGEGQLRASVSRHGPYGGVRRVGRASARLERPRRLLVRFDPDLIRRPASYRWSVHAATFARGCPRRTGCQDFAPQGGRTVRTRLGRPRG